MKDFHRKKLNHQAIRSEHRADKEENAYPGELLKAPPQQQATHQNKKHAKNEYRSNPNLDHNSENKHKKLSKNVPDLNNRKSKTSPPQTADKKRPRN